MTKQTKMILGGVAVLGLAYYLLNRGKGMKNMDGVRMSRFANASGMGVGMSDFGDVIPSDNFANITGKMCVYTNSNGNIEQYTSHGGRNPCPYGGKVN